MNCLFCDFASEKKETFIVLENENLIAFLDINPINPGHTLLVPKEHVCDIFDLESDIYHQLFTVAKELAPKMKVSLDAPRVGIAVEGFGVDHAHLHLVPVYAGNELNPDRAKPATQKELADMQEKLHTAFILNYGSRGRPDDF